MNLDVDTTPRELVNCVTHPLALIHVSYDDRNGWRMGVDVGEDGLNLFHG